MNVRHPMSVLHSFSIINIFYDKTDFKAFLFSCDYLEPCQTSLMEPFYENCLTKS